jgi:Ca2+-binding EF-hand superfamily protein
LIEVLHYHESEVSDLKVRRLLKLMDRFKRGKVLVDDFIKLISGNGIVGGGNIGRRASMILQNSS